MSIMTYDPRKKLDIIRELIEKKGIRIFPLLEDIPIAVCVTDRHGMFNLFNDHYCKLYAYQPEELLGKHFTMVVPEEKKGLLSQLHDDFIAHKYEMQGEWEVLTKEQQLVKILVSAAYVEDDQQNPFKVTFLVKLIKHDELEDRLDLTIGFLQHEQAVFSDQHMLFHDLQHSLPENFGLSDLLGMSETESGRRQRVEMIHRQDRGAVDVMELLYGLQQMEKKLYMLERRRFDLVKMIRKLLLESTHVFQEKNINLSMTIVDSNTYDLQDVPLEGDAIFFELMLQNLFFYMLRATEEQGFVRIQIERNDHVAIRIFNESGKSQRQPLREEEENRTRHLAFLVVRAHGGDITFSSSADGKQKVTIWLPDNT